MTIIVVLLLAQTAVLLAIFNVGRQRLDALRDQLARIELRLDSLEDARAAPRRNAARQDEKARAQALAASAAGSAVTHFAFPKAEPEGALRSAPRGGAYNRAPPLVPIEDAQDRAAPQRSAARIRRSGSRPLSPETVRTLACAALLALPALAAAFSAPAPMIMACVLVLIVAGFVAAMRPSWASAAWTSALAGGAWATAALASDAAASEPALFAGSAFLAASVGFVYAILQRVPWPGAILGFAMTVATFVLSLQIGLASAAGIGFAGIILVAAALGASTLRLEGFHVAAFLAAGAGLFLLSGQSAGAVWFTPAAVWTGACFGALAAWRAPTLGPRAGLLAVTGTVAPIFAVAALTNAGHGLETRWAASAAFAILASLFLVLIAVTARRAGRLGKLRLTGWALGLGSAWCAASAVTTATPPTLAALDVALLALLALGFIAIDRRHPAHVWRVSAVSLAGVASISAWSATANIGLVSNGMPAALVILLALAAPTALLAGCAALTKKRAPLYAASFEATAIVGAIAAATMAMRFGFTGEALWLHAPGFVELGAYAAMWLILSLGLAMHAAKGAEHVRLGFAALLAAAALALMLGAAMLWPLGWWRLGDNSLVSLGFLAPAMAAAGHWIIWRRNARSWRAHTARAAAAFLAAAWASLQTATILQTTTDAEWIVFGVGAVTVAAAFAVALLPMRPHRKLYPDTSIP